jgi:hypothetical protein
MTKRTLAQLKGGQCCVPIPAATSIFHGNEDNEVSHNSTTLKLKQPPCLASASLSQDQEGSSQLSNRGTATASEPSGIETETVAEKTEGAMPEETLDWDQYIFTVDNSIRHLLTCPKQVPRTVHCLPGQPVQLRFGRPQSTQRTRRPPIGGSACSHTQIVSARNVRCPGAFEQEWPGEEQSELVQQLEEILNERHMHVSRRHADSGEGLASTVELQEEGKRDLDLALECSSSGAEEQVSRKQFRRGSVYTANVDGPHASASENVYTANLDGPHASASENVCSTPVWLMTASTEPKQQGLMQVGPVLLCVQQLELPLGLAAEWEGSAEGADAAQLTGKTSPDRGLPSSCGGNKMQDRHHGKCSIPVPSCEQSDRVDLQIALRNLHSNRFATDQSGFATWLQRTHPFAGFAGSDLCSSTQQPLAEDIARAHLRSASKTLQTGRTAKLADLLKR